LYPALSEVSYHHPELVIASNTPSFDVFSIGLLVRHYFFAEISFGPYRLTFLALTRVD